MNKVAASETPALAPGSVVRQFVVKECLGLDLHAGLYRAESTETGHPVLLMEYLPAGLIERRAGVIEAVSGKAIQHQGAVAAYAKRLRETALIGHPALTAFDDIWQEHGTLVAVSTWQEGRNLLAVLEQRKSTPDADTLCQWARSICDALAALHRNGLLHGNLATHMLRVRQTGELILPLVAGELLQVDAPPWLAPEQHPLNTKPSPLGPWSDVYQLSATMYRLMTGHAPPTVLRRWEGAALEHLSEGAPHLPPGLVVATRKGLAMHAETRPQSVDAWLKLAGLPDRRHQRRYEPAAADVLDFDTQPGNSRFSSGTNISTNRKTVSIAMAAAEDRSGKRDSQWSPSTAAGEVADGGNIVAEETPTWVWLCLAVAVGAFISILVRTAV